MHLYRLINKAELLYRFREQGNNPTNSVLLPHGKRFCKSFTGRGKM